MDVIFIKTEDYDRIKQLKTGEKLEITIEAKDRSPMSVSIYRKESIWDDESLMSSYKNARFNGEYH